MRLSVRPTGLRLGDVLLYNEGTVFPVQRHEVVGLKAKSRVVRVTTRCEDELHCTLYSRRDLLSVERDI